MKSAAPDPILQKEWNESTSLGPAFQYNPWPVAHNPFWAKKKNAPCPTCNQTSTKRLCPSCHKELPFSIATENQLNLAIIGAKRSGKSHFVAVLIEELKNRIGLEFDMAVMPMNQETGDRYQDEFFNPLYVKKQILEETQSGDVNLRNREPLVFRLQFPSVDGRVGAVVTLCFFDAPGEDLKSEDQISRLTKYVYNADGLILLTEVADKSNKGSGQHNAHPSQSIVESIIRIYETAHGLSAQQNIPASIALTVSKMDSVEEYFPERHHPIWQNPLHRDGFDMSDYYLCSAEVEGALRESGAGQLCTLSKLRFGEKNTGFFAISSLGHTPNGANVGEIEPIRVSEPLLWLLGQFGLIPMIGLGAEDS